MTTTTMSRGKTYDMVYIAVFAVVMAIRSVYITDLRRVPGSRCARR